MSTTLNQQAEDLRRCCDALAAKLGHERWLREREEDAHEVTRDQRDSAQEKLAEARRLLEESLEVDGGIPDKASPDSLNGRIYRFLTADKGDAAHEEG